MDMFSELMGFVGILEESLKILLTSGSLMASTTLVTLIPNFLLFLSNIFSIKLLVFDLFAKSHLLTTVDQFDDVDFFELVFSIKEDIQVLSGVKLIFFLSYSLVTLFSIVALLLASTISRSSKNFESKQLLSGIDTWPLPLITWIYATLTGVCYTLFLVGLLGFLMVISDGIIASVFACIVLVILSISLFLHSVVVWTSGLVVFVVEESCYGIETVERAEDYMLGGTLNGLSLNLLTMVASVIMLIACQLLTFNQRLVTSFIVGLVIINMVSLMKIFSFMAHMVFYYQYKKNHEDELELPLQMGYISLIDAFV